MPRSLIVCEVSNRNLTDAECLACAKCWGMQPSWQDGTLRHCRFNYPMMHALLAPQEDREHAGISATMLTGCIRQGVWKTRKDYAVYPGQMWAALDGTFVHAALEAYNEPDILAEVRLVKKMPSGVTITGKMDRYLPALRRLEDYKTKEGGKLFTEPPPDYVAQLNIYRYMLETGCAILATGEYVQYPVEHLWLFPLSHKAPGNPVVCPIWPLERTKSFIEERLAVYIQAQEDANYLPPRRYAEPKRRTFCTDFCPFVDRCHDAGGELEDHSFEY